jgi:hypothetical protein
VVAIVRMPCRKDCKKNGNKHAPSIAKFTYPPRAWWYRGHYVWRKTLIDSARCE